MSTWMRSAVEHRLDAWLRSPASIECSLDGTLLQADRLLLSRILCLSGCAREEIRGRHHRIVVDPEEAARAAGRHSLPGRRAACTRTEQDRSEGSERPSR